MQEEDPPSLSQVALLGTVLEELLAGLLLQSVPALGRHAVLQLGHVLVGLKPHKAQWTQDRRKGGDPGRLLARVLWRKQRAQLPVSRGICPPLPVRSPSSSRLE